jgi:hypothetical protein
MVIIQLWGYNGYNPVILSYLVIAIINFDAILSYLVK